MLPLIGTVASVVFLVVYSIVVLVVFIDVVSGIDVIVVTFEYAWPPFCYLCLHWRYSRFCSYCNGGCLCRQRMHSHSGRIWRFSRRWRHVHGLFHRFYPHIVVGVFIFDVIAIFGAVVAFVSVIVIVVLRWRMFANLCSELCFHLLLTCRCSL